MIEIRLKASGSPVRGWVTGVDTADGYQAGIIKVGAKRRFMKLYHRRDSLEPGAGRERFHRAGAAA